MSHHRECLGTMPSAQDPALAGGDKVTDTWMVGWQASKYSPRLSESRSSCGCLWRPHFLKCFNCDRTSVILNILPHLSRSTFFLKICFHAERESEWFWSLDFYLLPRAGQLLYGPITPCPAGEQEPGEEVKWKSTQEIHFSGMSCCSEVAAKSWLTANRGFFLCVLEAMSVRVLAVHQQFQLMHCITLWFQLFNPQTWTCQRILCLHEIYLWY